MKSTSISVLLLYACASVAAAQEDALLPTHLIEAEQIFATGTLRYVGNQGDASIFGADGNFKGTTFQFQVDAGVGLGAGFEIDASIYMQFRDETKASFNDFTELETTNKGFSDLLLEGRYRIFEDGEGLPQLIVGALLVAPVGNDKEGQPKFWPGGVPSGIPKEDGGIGSGVWHYGLEAGISKNLVFVEPYALTSYVIGGSRTHNGVHEDRADTWNLLLGAQWHLSPVTTLDTRIQFSRDGIDKQETGGSQVTEEAHFVYTPSVSLFVHLGSQVTFFASGGISFQENHEVNDIVQLDVRNDHAFFFQLGLHFLIGSK
jgi:hypothetical protein